MICAALHSCYLSFELSLNFLKFLKVLVPESEELASHSPYQQLDIVGLVFQHLHVVVVLLLELVRELLDQSLLSVDDVLERRLLLLDGLVEFFALLLLFEL